MKLSSTDLVNLSALDNKMGKIGAYVKGVIVGTQTGLILNGEGGTGKSYRVIAELREAKVQFCHHQGRVTARGLFDALALNPDSIHLIEDAEALYKDKNFTGLCRNALHSQDHKRHGVRNVTWVTTAQLDPVPFTGGIIIIGNSKMDDKLADFRALGTRCPVIDLDVSNEEVLSLMKKVALEGHSDGYLFLTPAECWEVVEFIEAKLTELKRNLDMRLLIQGFKYRLQERYDATGGFSWKDLLEGQIAKTVTPTSYRRADKLKDETAIALEIDAMKIPYAAKLKLWLERTGREGDGKASFSRAVKRK